MTQELNEGRKREKYMTEYHIPGYEYAGPGTHIISRIENQVKPRNFIDEASLIHDIEYMKKNNQFNADNNMWLNLVRRHSWMYPLANLVRIAFIAKDISGLKANDYENDDVYNYLKDKAFRPYKMKFKDD